MKNVKNLIMYQATTRDYKIGDKLEFGKERNFQAERVFNTNYKMENAENGMAEMFLTEKLKNKKYKLKHDDIKSISLIDDKNMYICYIPLEKEEIDLCIVPGLSFDKNGFRLGYGGGYYDRFLENTNMYAIGICFKELVADKLPREENDISVNEVIII